MTDIVLTTYDWVPDLPRGYVRDLRARWALEEAGFAYRIESVPFRERNAGDFAPHPFEQVPWLVQDGQTIFESGAILLHLGEQSNRLMPSDPAGRSAVVQWLFAALNSVEMATLPHSIYRFTGDEGDSAGRQVLDRFLASRLAHMETVLAGRDWLAVDFSIADIAMSDVLRLMDRFDRLADHPACRAYVARATSRPAFQKAHADQMAHFASAD